MGTVSETYDAMVADGLQRDPAQERIVARLDAMASDLEQSRGLVSRLVTSRSPARGLYIWGDVGRGKSMLVDALMGTLDGVPARRTHFHAFMRDIHRALHKARGAGTSDPVAAAADAVTGKLSLLALDEVEVTDIVDAMIVGRVFERIFERGITLLATSNRAPSDLYRDGLKRDLFLPFVRLVESHVDIAHLDSDTDYRRDGAINGGLYLTPCDDQGPQRFEALWEDLPSDAAEPLQLGAKTQLPRKGVAVRATFDALCRGPMAASDFLDLAERTEIVFLDGVPHLGERDHDAARRFILLIDTLYDTGRGLVVAAADVPESLYADGDFAEEFQRTVSRLHEMCRPDWPGSAALR